MLTQVESPNVVTCSSAPAADVSAFAGQGPELLTLPAGEVLFQEGDPRSHVFRVETGALCLFKSREDGTQDVLEFAFPGDLVGIGYLDSHVCSAQATMETSLSCLPRSALDVEGESGSRGRLTSAIERELAFLEASLVQRSTADPLQRIAALFTTLSRYNAYEGRDPSLITDSLKCGVVAGYLDIGLDDLALRLTELEAKGLVEPSADGLRLLDLDGLEALADNPDA